MFLSLYGTKKLPFLAWNKHLNSLHFQTMDEDWFECQIHLLVTLHWQYNLTAHFYDTGLLPCIIYSSTQADDI